MSHADPEQLAGLALDPTDGPVDVREHVETCPECAGLVAAFTGVRRRAGADALVPPPAELRAKVMAEIRSGDAPTVSLPARKRARVVVLTDSTGLVDGIDEDRHVRLVDDMALGVGDAADQERVDAIAAIGEDAVGRRHLQRRHRDSLPDGDVADRRARPLLGREDDALCLAGEVDAGRLAEPEALDPLTQARLLQLEGDRDDADVRRLRQDLRDGHRLRAALDGQQVSQPTIDLKTSFTAAARAAGLIKSNQTFDPFANENNFLLGAFIFEDVGVTAYKGAAPLIDNKTYLEAAAGILAVEAYHAGIVRSALYQKGLFAEVKKISELRDAVDGPSDDDQNLRSSGKHANIVPTDASGIAYSRSAGQVLNIVYLNNRATSNGGFFPAGVNGTIRTSAASA